MTIIALDWWRKHIWLAYAKDSQSIVFPIGSLDNTPDVMYSLAHIFAERGVTTLVLGYPSKQQDVQRSIDSFIKQLSLFISPECQIHKVNEDYTSVQAMNHLWTQKKTAAEDSLAAVYIMENRIKQQVD